MLCDALLLFLSIMFHDFRSIVYIDQENDTLVISSILLKCCEIYLWAASPSSSSIALSSPASQVPPVVISLGTKSVFFIP